MAWVMKYMGEGTSDLVWEPDPNSPAPFWVQGGGLTNYNEGTDMGVTPTAYYDPRAGNIGVNGAFQAPITGYTDGSGENPTATAIYGNPVPTGETVSGADFTNFNSQFWQGKHDPASTHWMQAYKDLMQWGGPRLVQTAAQDGYFDKFPTFTDPADWARLQGRFGTDQNQGGLWGDSPGDFIGRNIAESNAQDEAHTQGQWANLARIVLAAVGGMAFQGAGATTSASSAPSATAAGAGATQMGLVGADYGAGAAGAFDTFGSVGTGLEGTTGEPGYLASDTGAYTGATGSSAEMSGGGMDWWDELMKETGEYGVDPASLESGYNASYGDGFYGETMPFSGKDVLKGGSLFKQLFDSGGGLVKSLAGGVRDLLPSANTAAAIAPILAAIAYARSQGPFNTSRLESTYDQFDPSAVAFEYDQNTAAGRGALTSSLQNRGVMGSSFGNMDLTNFNTTRDLGRRSLVNQGIAARGDMAKALMDAEFKERQLKNNLYGTSLLALGNVFGAKNEPRVA